jgi:hypothetical protein
MKLVGLRGLCALLLSLGALAALPAIAQAADTFADASRPNDDGDCLTPATACQTITGANGALAKASPGSTVRVEPGTYAENVTLSGGISLVAAAGNPVIAPTTGVGVTVTGGPAVTVGGLTFASDADGPELLLGDGAGSATVTGNNFIDRTPNDANQAVGVRTTSRGAPQILDNGFTLLQDAVQVLSPSAGLAGTPLISGNIIIGTPDFGTGIMVRSTDTQGVTAPTTAALVGNQIEQGDDESTGVLVIDGGSVVGDPSIPGAGLTMLRNRILGGGDGLRDFGARAPVTLFGDVIARTGSVSPGQVVHSAINANANASLGGDLTVTNTDLVNNADPAIQLADNHLTLDSSIVTGSISQAPEGASGCTITFSAGPTTSGNSCQTFQTNQPPRFIDQENNDFHLNPALDLALIDQGNPAAPPAGATDFDGEPRALDGDGACPLVPIRDIGADEFNPGFFTCPPPEPPPGGGISGAPPGGGVQASAPPTGLRAAALKKCKRRHGQARIKCARRARRLPR